MLNLPKIFLQVAKMKTDIQRLRWFESTFFPVSKLSFPSPTLDSAGEGEVEDRTTKEDLEPADSIIVEDKMADLKLEES